ncbi:MAG: CCA tRNA nucleotidyltransferase, partial [Microcystaceae cyanobacterium]
VFPKGTVDFALREGLTLEQDLQRRDFTINGIAYNLHQETLIDPLNGVKDIQKKQLKMISKANLADDPLRLLRAYRQAAQLGFTIELETRNTLRNLARLITTIAAERVQAELNYLLASSKGNQWLLAAYEDGLILPWFPNATLDHLSLLEKVDLALASLKNYLTTEKYVTFLGNLGKKGLATAKLVCLVTMESEKAEAELANLKYSRLEIRAIHGILTAYPRLIQSDFKNNLRSQYFLFLEAGKYLPIFVLFALAKMPESELTFYLLDRYLQENDAVAHPQALLKGNDLIDHLQIKPSPLIGQLLTELQVAQIEGKISCKAEAFDYAQVFIQAQSLI